MSLELTHTHGFTLVELLVVLGVVAICLAGALLSLQSGFAMHTARGAAQCWQAAAAWAQTDVIWRGGSRTIFAGSSDLSIADGKAVNHVTFNQAMPECVITANPTAWQLPDQVRVRFTGEFASPDGGGSLYFHAPRGAYRVVVRPVSGLSVRSYKMGGQ